MHQKSFLFLLLFSLVSTFTYSQAKYSNEFLNIGVGGRAQGLGNAVIASVDDVTAGFWNPAGLAANASFEGLEVGAMHTEWFAGIGTYDYLGIILPFSNDKRRIGISAVRFGIDNIPNTLSLYESDGTVNFDNLSSFSAADYAFLLSYAQEISLNQGRLLVGGNIKVVHRRIGPFATSWGFGLDLGLQYWRNKWKFALVARDVPSTFNGWSFDFTEDEREVLELTNNEIPISNVEVTNPSFIFGIYRRFQTGKIGIAPELNWIVTTDGERNTLVSSSTFSMDPAFGIELDYSQFAFLRAGVNQFQELVDIDGGTTTTARPSIGVGFKISNLKVDYAFSDLGAEDDTFSHIISLILRLKPKNK
ncbi:MAG: hypothetical protein AAF242_13125 [Bacteroidota bacterium]